MENFLPRSVMDADLIFRAPTLPPPAEASRPSRRHSQKMDKMAAAAKEVADAMEDVDGGDKGKSGEDDENLSAPVYTSHDPIDTVEWPIPIRWPPKDPRSQNPDNMVTTPLPGRPCTHTYA